MEELEFQRAFEESEALFMSLLYLAWCTMLSLSSCPFNSLVSKVFSSVALEGTADACDIEDLCVGDIVTYEWQVQASLRLASTCVTRIIGSLALHVGGITCGVH